MKHSGIPSLPQPTPTSGSRGRSNAGARRALGGALLAFLVIGVTGCVSSSAHREVVDERDEALVKNARLEERVRRMEDSTESLETERVALLDQLEDLNIERDTLLERRDALDLEVSRLSSSEATLSDELADREARLAAANQEMLTLKSTYTDLVTDLESEVARGVIEIEQLRSGLRVAVADEILFASGSARIGSEGETLLGKVAERLGELDYAIDVTGHTDSIPISGALTKRYPTNWELASARASSVVRLFRSAGIDGGRLRVISRAEFDPVASNDDSEGRRENRRIEITLRPTNSTEIPSGREAPQTGVDAAGTPARTAPAPAGTKEGAGQPAPSS